MQAPHLTILLGGGGGGEMSSLHYCLLTLFFVTIVGEKTRVEEQEEKARRFFEQNGRAASHSNNWVVLVDTSRFWSNYRHAANVLSMYHIAKRHGVPDSNIIVMLGDDIPCNVRNIFPATIYNNADHSVNLYGSNVEVDYRGYEVTVEAFLRILTDRHPAGTPQNKRLLSDENSNILIYLSGHGGDQFIKFQDAAEVTNQDVQESLWQMWIAKRYRSVLLLVETCQAATLIENITAPAVISFGSSVRGQNSYSHHNDPEVGQHVIDRMTYFTLEKLSPLEAHSPLSVYSYFKSFKPKLLLSDPQYYSTHPLKLSQIRIMDFFSFKETKKVDVYESDAAVKGEALPWMSASRTTVDTSGSDVFLSTGSGRAGSSQGVVQHLACLHDTLREIGGDSVPIACLGGLLLGVAMTFL